MKRTRAPAGTAGSLLLAALVVAPIVALAWHAVQGGAAQWPHLLRYVLPGAAANTAMLLAGVGVLTLALGVGSAWLVTAYTFPCRAMLTWALMLPLAMPTYVVAYAYLDLLHPIGPLQSAVRYLLGYTSPRDFRLPDLRSLPGAIALLGLVLYPYVYLTTRALFLTQPASLFEAARTLGVTSAGTFWRVALPLARPAIVAGGSLALLETLNDVGASEFLGVQTLTVAVYTTWITRSDLAGAAQIALAMLGVVVLIVLMERNSRKRLRYAHAARMRPLPPVALQGAGAWFACALGAVPVVLGFLAPAAYLLVQSVLRLQHSGLLSAALIRGLANTVIVAAIGTTITVAAGLLVGWTVRRERESAGTTIANALPRLANLGYPIPGTVLAIGLLTPFAMADRIIAAMADTTRLVVLSSITGLLTAYMVRFLAIPASMSEAGLARIAPSLEQSARLLGESPWGVLRRVQLPLLVPALAAAATLVFVDILKELPATLLLRPANFETLATLLYAEATRGAYEDGALAALIIVVVGLVPVILFTRARWKGYR